MPTFALAISLLASFSQGNLTFRRRGGLCPSRPQTLNHADDPLEVVMASAQPKPDFKRERRAASSPPAAATKEAGGGLPPSPPSAPTAPPPSPRRARGGRGGPSATPPPRTCRAP